MAFKDSLRKSVKDWLENDSTDSTSYRDRRPLSSNDIDDFEFEAKHREDPLWTEIETLIYELERRRPIRAAKLRQDLRWLRKEAKRRGLRWGK